LWVFYLGWGVLGGGGGGFWVWLVFFVFVEEGFQELNARSDRLVHRGMKWTQESRLGVK